MVIVIIILSIIAIVEFAIIWVQSVRSKSIDKEFNRIVMENAKLLDDRIRTIKKIDGVLME